MVMLADEDQADLERIAAAWSCSKAEAAALALRATFARWRGEAPELGPLGLEAAASAGALGLALPRRIVEGLEDRGIQAGRATDGRDEEAFGAELEHDPDDDGRQVPATDGRA